MGGMSRLIAIAMSCLVLGAGAAQAQVALPEFAPAAVRIFNSRAPIAPMNSITPENPAALQWGAPSRIAVGAIQGEKADAFDGNASDYSGNFVGFRWVDRSVALAGAQSDFTVEFPPTTDAMGQPVVPLQEKEQTAFALSFMWPANLAWGIGTSALTSVTIPGMAERIDTDATTLGISWRVGENLFLGAGAGREDARRIAPTPFADASRNFAMAGIGLRGGGTLSWRLEADVIQREDFEDGAGVVVYPGYDLTLVSAEFILWDLLLGVTSFHAEEKNAQGAEVDGFTIDFGYVPFRGLTISGRFESSEVNLGPDLIAKEEVNNIVLAIQF